MDRPGGRKGDERPPAQYPSEFASVRFRYTNVHTSQLGISEDRRSGRTSQLLGVKTLLVRPQSRLVCLLANQQNTAS
jgi:hypothetical protein